MSGYQCCGNGLSSRSSFGYPNPFRPNYGMIHYDQVIQPSMTSSVPFELKKYGLDLSYDICYEPYVLEVKYAPRKCCVKKPKTICCKKDKEYVTVDMNPCCKDSKEYVTVDINPCKKKKCKKEKIETCGCSKKCRDEKTHKSRKKFYTSSVKLSGNDLFYEDSLEFVKGKRNSRGCPDGRCQ